MRIDLAGLRMSDGTPDANGCLWYVNEWEGWDSANLSQSLGGLTARHGSTLLENRFESRTVVLRGVMKAPDEAAFWAAYYTATGGLLSLFEERALDVYEAPTPKRLMVIQGAATRLTFVGVGAFNFEITATALNPLKTALTSTTTTVTAGSTLSIFNDGNFYAYPKVTVGGSVNLLDTANSLRLLTSIAVPSGTVFDAWTRTVRNGSSNLYNNLDPASQWLVFQPGENPIQNLGTSDASLEWRDTYI